MINTKDSWSFSRDAVFNMCKYKYYYRYIAPRETDTLLGKLQRINFLNEYLFFSFKNSFQSLIISQNWLHKELEFQELVLEKLTELCRYATWEFLHPHKSDIIFYEHIYCSEKWSNPKEYSNAIIEKFRDRIHLFLETEIVTQLIHVPQLSWCRITSPMPFEFMGFSILFSPLLIWQEFGTSRCFELSLYKQSTERAMAHCNLFSLYATLNLYSEPDGIQYNTMNFGEGETITLAPTIDGMIQLKDTIQKSQNAQKQFPWHGPPEKQFRVNKNNCDTCEFKAFCY